MILESLTDDGAYGIIVGNSLEIILFGTYTIFFAFAMLILTVYRRPLPVDWVAVVATMTLYGTCMAHCGLITTDRHSTFGSPYPMPTGPEMSGLLRGADVVLKLSAFHSQIIMIHRCWSLWDHRWAVFCLPTLVAIAGFACSMVGPATLPASEFRSPFIAPRLPSFDIPFCVLSLLINILVTSLIIYRLRKMSAPARSFKSISDLTWSIAICFVETGALLAVAQLAMLVFLALEHPFIIVVESVAAQIYGIAPTLMIIRLGIRLLPEGRVRWSTTAPEFSTVVVCTTFSDEDTENGTENGVLPTGSTSALPSSYGHSKEP
ncbi:hypothetical protein BD414DRAFT_278920 [Trametes punicea]|nr:hypothetical protein BD414DRAFT_278920 [Trametes punicea]